MVLAELRLKPVILGGGRVGIGRKREKMKEREREREKEMPG